MKDLEESVAVTPSKDPSESEKMGVVEAESKKELTPPPSDEARLHESP